MRGRVKRGEKVGVKFPREGIFRHGVHNVGAKAVGLVRTRTTTTLGS